MSTPQITLYTGDVPNRATDSASEFADNADDTMEYLLPLAEEYNALADFVNSAAESIDGASNYVGKWEGLSGAYDLGVSVLHDGYTWLLLEDVTYIQQSEPSGSNDDWQLLASFTQQQTNTADIATNTADIATNTADIATNTADIATNTADIATNNTFSSSDQRVKTALNATGDAPVYGVRAWVKYNGVTDTIDASGNVLSVTKNAIGNYTVNFIDEMPTSYCASGLAGSNSAGQISNILPVTYTSTSFTFYTANESVSLTDTAIINLSFIG